MSLEINAACTSRCGLKRAALSLALMLSIAAVGLDEKPVWARGNDPAESELKPEAPAETVRLYHKSDEIKPDNPEHQALFTALNQWMRQNMAAYNYDETDLHDPFAWLKVLRPPRTPYIPSIIRWDIAQYKLVATIRDKNGSMVFAAFEDRVEGHDYLSRQGDRIGRNNGHIKRINGSSVTVEETGPGPDSPVRLLEIKLDP